MRKFLVIAFIIVVAALCGGMAAQELPALDCLGDVDSASAAPWSGGRTVDIMPYWDSLAELVGTDIYNGDTDNPYERWDIPFMAGGYLRINGALSSGEHFEVWVWHYRDMIYLFPYNDLTVIFDADGNGAMHPCGGFAVTSMDFARAFIIDADGR